MALKNAFENMSTEAKQNAIIDLLLQLLSQQTATDALQAPRGLQYARDVNDRMRVVVDNSPSGYQQIVFGNTVSSGLSVGGPGSAPLYYSSGSPTAFDARQQLADIGQQNINYIRQSRWVFS